MCSLGKKKEISYKDMDKILRNNGFVCVSKKGSHKKYKRDNKHIVINHDLNMIVARRIIKENNLIVHS